MLGECEYCGSKLVFNGHARPKTITHPLLVQHKCLLHWTPRRMICTNSECRKSVSEHNYFTFPGFSISYATIRQIMLDLRKENMTYKDIAERNCVSVSQVVTYFDSFVHAPRNLHLPENLGIDEIHSDMAKYGSKYLCVLVDNNAHQIFDILPSRSKKELIKYFEQYSSEELGKVRYVTIDMWEPYKDVAYKMFKNCEVAVDPFHVIKHLVDSFTDLRISIMKSVVYGSPSYYLLKKWNWLLTTRDVEFDNEKVYNHVFNRYMNRRDLLNEILAISDDLSIAHHLLKLYQDFNHECPPEDAEDQMDLIIESFAEAEVHVYREFLNMIITWKKEIINSFHRPTGRKQTNALTENMNQRIRTYLSVSKGNSNFERFRRRILYCLNDNIFFSCTKFLTTLKQEGKKRRTYNKNATSNA